MARQVGDLRSLVVADQQHLGHGAHPDGAVRACTRSSTLPCPPRSGDSIQPSTVAAARLERVVDLLADPFVHRRVGDHPRAAGHLGPSGLELRLDQQHQRHRRARSSAISASSTRVSEMNDRSATTASTTPADRRRCGVADVEPLEHDDPWIAAQPGVQLTVADVERDHLRAPRCSRQSVNPPVDAPASRTRSPVTSTANGSRAASSFSPPRLTNRGGGPCSSTASPAWTKPAGLVGQRPLTSTRPSLDRARRPRRHGWPPAGGAPARRRAVAAGRHGAQPERRERSRGGGRPTAQVGRRVGDLARAVTPL